MLSVYTLSVLVSPLASWGDFSITLGVCVCFLLNCSSTHTVKRGKSMSPYTSENTPQKVTEVARTCMYTQ